MKKVTIISVLGILLAILQGVKAQETYLPVFGNDSTTFYYYSQYAETREFYEMNFTKRKDNNPNTYEYKFWGNDTWLEVSQDNSKLWWVRDNYPISTDTTKILLMDLNLDVGDVYTYSNSHARFDFTVEKVFIKENRKHIVFQVECPDSYLILHLYGMPEVVAKNFTLEFIEGVGPNIPFKLFGAIPTESNNCSLYLTAWLCSIDRDGAFYYGIEKFYPYWGLKNIYLDVDKITPAHIEIYPVPTKKTLNISLPQDMEGKVTILNTSGGLICTFPITSRSSTISLSNLSPGVYFLRIESESFRSIKKIIKT